MRFSSQAIILLVVLAVLDNTALAAAKKPSRSASSRRSSSRAGPARSSGRPSVSKRRAEPEYDIEDEELGFDDPFESPEDDDYDDYEEEEEIEERPRSRRPAPRKGAPSKRTPSGRKPRSRYEDEEDDYDRPRRGGPPSRRGPPPRRGGRPPSRRGQMVPAYGRQQQPSTFTRGLSAFRNSMPDPATVREAAVNSLNAARETTTSLSSNLYREVKGLTSSELEQVMLKATRPDDTAVKGKHAERLVGVTYQISARYDIYDAVLRKLWSKMAEKDWRTTIKALYIMHRFAADGAPEHAPALKVRFESSASPLCTFASTAFLTFFLLSHITGTSSRASSNSRS